MNEKWLKYLNRLSLPIQMVVVMMGYFVIEAISRHSVREAYTYMTERPLVFLYNSFLIFTTTLLVYLVRRRVFMRTLLAIFWLVLGIINGVLLANRVTPFTGPDLHLITDAFKIANKYLSPVFFVIVIILAAAALIGLVFLFLKGPKYQGKMTYKLNIPLVLAGVLAFAGTTKLALEKRVLSNYFEILRLPMKTMDILTVWQPPYLTQASAVPGITLRHPSKESRRARAALPRREKNVPILFSCSLSPSLILRW